MTIKTLFPVIIAAAALLVLAAIFWGWRQGGLAIMQLGMSLC